MKSGMVKLCQYVILRVSGCQVCDYIPTQKRHRLDSRQTMQTILIDCEQTSKGYKVMNLKTSEISIKHVIYFEELKKIDKRGTMLDNADGKDQYNTSVIDINVPVCSKSESEVWTLMEYRMQAVL